MASRLHSPVEPVPLPFRFHEAVRDRARRADATPLQLGAPGFSDHALHARLDLALVTLANQRRRAIRLLHAGCGDGSLLLSAARRASALGFVAIEARGVDPSPRRIAAARAATATLDDPAIGLTFEVGDVRDALADEDDGACDIVLCLDRIGHLTAAARNAIAVGLARITDGTLFVADEALGRGGLRALG